MQTQMDVRTTLAAVTPYELRAATLIAALAATGDEDVSGGSALVCGFVDALLADALTPERTLVFVKTVLALANWPRGRPGVDRDRERASLVTLCIERYFVVRTPSAVPANGAHV